MTVAKIFGAFLMTLILGMSFGAIDTAEAKENNQLITEFIKCDDIKTKNKGNAARYRKLACFTDLAGKVSDSDMKKIQKTRDAYDKCNDNRFKGDRQCILPFQECDSIKTKNKGNAARYRKIACMRDLAFVAACRSPVHSYDAGRAIMLHYKRYTSGKYGVEKRPLCKSGV